jgi:biopolymer transport protein ExbD
MNLHRPARHEYEFQMVSFVDVIFVLLSFFVMGSQFRSLERDMGLGYARPQPLGAALQPGDFPQQVRVEVRRSGDGMVIRVAQATLTENALGALTAKLQEVNLPQTPVVVAAEASLSVDQVAHVLDAVLASPMKNVSVAALGESPGRPS